MQPRIILVVLSAICATAAAGTVAYANGAASTQRFTLTTKTVDGTDTPIRLVAAGPSQGLGTVQLKSSRDNRVDHMTLQLKNGTVFLVATEKSFVVHPNLRTCIAISSGQGTFTINGGTSAFHGASGHGTYVRHATLIGGRGPSGACLGRTAPLKATILTVVLTGTAALP
jgi:hypothetical protein